MHSYLRAALPAALLLTGLLQTAQAQTAPPPPIKAGTVAPAFVTQTVAGKPLSLKSLRGKVVLLDIWATWCGPCRLVTPILQSLHQKYGSKGLQVVGLSVDDSGSAGQVKPFQKANKLTYTMAVSPEANAKAAMAYHAEGIPSIYLIDQKGIVRWSQTGIAGDLKTEEQELNQRISELLAKNSTANKMATARK